MVAQRNVNPAKVQAPPAPGQGHQSAMASGVAPPVSIGHQVGSKGGGYQGTPRTTSATQHSSEVLHQRSKMPLCPARMAVGGIAVAAVLGYLTLYTKKKPEATALDVARVATGMATTENTRPRN
ncbi:hypothetical protein PHJA_001556000 [Phtheirospermum japonicum]|uniref:Uncharacterized protein n=1 Tax=Phtheirospermum japonicum TaxID=374723 RepID=A0A830C4T7_9LAMI|nr:hypothetical protein PHJA_001556000 [Phtheirospermum japonicum]